MSKGPEAGECSGVWGTASGEASWSVECLKVGSLYPKSSIVGFLKSSVAPIFPGLLSLAEAGYHMGAKNKCITTHVPVPVSAVGLRLVNNCSEAVICCDT